MHKANMTEFEKLVQEGFLLLPEKVRERIQNVALLIEDEPSEEVRQREGLGKGKTLLGLYQGIPATARGDSYGVGPTVPDTITLYQLPIEEAAAEGGKDVRAVIAETIWHEYAHYFGMSEGEVRFRESSRIPDTEIAVFGGGCFWCTEAVFKMLKGVVSVTPGYAGGATPDPTYEAVSSGRTGHAEVTRIEYAPAQVSFRTLLTVFFATHDPTTLNRQGPDVGTQYRSVIFYTTLAQREEAEAFIRELEESTKEGNPVVTEVKPFTEFYPAEDYHRDYFARHPEQAYCDLVISPKVEKVQKKFAELLKNNQ